MAELVAGAFLSSFLQVAFERLSSPHLLNFFRGRKLDDGLLRKLHIILISVDKIIEDAEERQYRDLRVKQWLHELKHEVFMAQDLLDDIAIEALRQDLHVAEFQTSVAKKVRGLFSALVTPNQFDNKKIESGIQGVLSNLEYLVRQNEILGLREGPSAGLQLGAITKIFQRSPTTLLIDESKLCGRDADKERLVDILLSPNMGGGQFPMDVIAITGMGGMGKTILARLVYEDVRLKNRFKQRAWVCVSDEFNAHEVTKVILLSLDPSTEKSTNFASSRDHPSAKSTDFESAFDHPTKKSTDFYSCQRKLKEMLKGKEFFLVLDDIWNENHKIWEDFQAPLKHVAPQSKILITSRNVKVAEVMCCNFTHALKPLKKVDCMKLFAKYAFDTEVEAANPALVQIGKRIVKRCGGLPLAVKTLASLLHRKLSLQYWNKILNSDIWELSENDCNIIPSLRLSYHYLPSNLKRCFAYCSIYPKDYDIEKNEIIQLWMADGLICPTQKRMSLEEMGNEILNELESRSFFEPSMKGDDYFTMHDLVNDLSKAVTQEFCVQVEPDHTQDMSTKTRYFSCVSKLDGEYLEISEKVLKCHQLRGFFLLNPSIRPNFVVHVDIMSQLSRLKFIRELSLRGCRKIKNLSNDISNLKHLHYLDLSFTQIKKLPDSMCMLINLQTLKLRGCHRLEELPANLFKLISLHHLDLEDSGIRKMPKYMGKLDELRTMSQFVVSKKGGSNIKELGALVHLTGSLTISNMGSINDARDLREANLKEKKLVKLKLLYSRGKYGSNKAQQHEHLLEAVEPNETVKDLTVEGYKGAEFPKWVSVSEYLPHLVSLCLSNCESIVRLPALGQLPSLQKLSIQYCKGIKVINKEFYGNGSLNAPFPSLSYLQFHALREWEEWEICYEGESFPCLQELYLDFCRSLKKCLPQHLPCLKTLRIDECGNLEATLPKSPSMKNLILVRCDKIVMPRWSILDVSLPLSKSGMLSSLQHLVIGGCPNVIKSGRVLEYDRNCDVHVDYNFPV